MGDLMDERRCRAKSKRSGERCKRAAAIGGHVCAIHGGKSPQAKAAAARRVAEEQAKRDVELFGGRKDIHPAQALLDLVQWTAGEVDYWRTRITELEEKDMTWGTTRKKEGGQDQGVTKEAKPHIAYSMYESAAKRLESHCVAALRAGVEEKRLALAQSVGAQIAGLLRAVMEQLQLTDDQWSMAAEVVPAELRKIGASTP